MQYLKRIAKGLLRRCSSRYREREALARHRIPFPDCYKKSGVVFIHVPKAAGTSVSDALYGRNIGHWSLSNLWDMYPHSMRAYRTCAVVREPVSRFVSAFHYLKKGGMNSYDKAFSEKYLAQFNTAEQCALHLINGASKKAILEFEHFRTQVSWIVDAKLEKTADCVVAITQLNMLRKWLMHLTGTEYTFGKLNAITKSANDKETLSPHVRSGIEAIYASDVVLYNALVEKAGCMISAAKEKAGHNQALRELLLVGVRRG